MIPHCIVTAAENAPMMPRNRWLGMYCFFHAGDTTLGNAKLTTPRTQFWLYNPKVTMPIHE